VQVLELVPLAGGAGADVILHRLAKVGRVKVPAEAVERALNTLMSVVMDDGEHLMEQW